LNPQGVPIPDLLRDLLEAAGPSGYEEPAARVWREAASGFATVSSDTLGTSFARVGTGDRPALALIGHIDEIGVSITNIDASGRLAYKTIGGFDPFVAAGQRITIAGPEGPVEGVLVARERPRGERGETALKHDDIHVDIGAATAEEAQARVMPGDVGVWHGEPIELPNNRLVSRALDNRLGAYAVLEAARRVAESGDAAVDVVAVASVQEEVAHGGVRPAVFALEPQAAVVVDVTWSTDIPGGDERTSGKVELGSGAAITRGTVLNPRIVDLLLDAAREEQIPYCIEVYPNRTYTDADEVHDLRTGVPTGLVSIPLRYIHSPCELGSLDDLEATIALLTAFARRLTPETSFLR
jgi:putative aminopeptidase FrvX